ncbi:hypothetical protein [Phycicoccus avicenniae]|uniref:hypothetical protein n=1 Tax=Phycicoccus avicenniae TaxID=2828860 RepID=UPI003D2DEF91
MGSDRWLRRVYYVAVLGVAAAGLVVGITAKGWWSTPLGWALLLLWVVCTAVALSRTLRRDRAGAGRTG